MIYIDDMNIPMNGKNFSCLFSDEPDHKELHALAESLGIPRNRFEEHTTPPCYMLDGEQCRKVKEKGVKFVSVGSEERLNAVLVYKRRRAEKQQKENPVIRQGRY